MEELKEDYSGLSREEQQELAEGWLEESTITFQKHQYAVAIKHAQRAIPIFRSLEKWERYLKARGLLTYLWLESGKNNTIDRPIVYTEETLKLCRQKIPPTHETTLFLLHVAGQVYAEMGQFTQGLQCALDYFRLAKEKKIPNYGDLMKSCMQTSMCYQYLRDYPKGVEYGEKAVGYGLKTLEKEKFEDSELIQTYVILGAAYYKYGDNENALSNTHKALEIARKTTTKISAHNLAPMYANLSAFYQKSGDFKQNILYARKSFDLLLQEIGEEHYITAASEPPLKFKDKKMLSSQDN